MIFSVFCTDLKEHSGVIGQARCQGQTAERFAVGSGVVERVPSLHSGGTAPCRGRLELCRRESPTRSLHSVWPQCSLTGKPRALGVAKCSEVYQDGDQRAES